jgi:hypothetical protein
MNSETETHIREAVISALRDGNDECAHKLFSFLSHTSSPPQRIPTEPPLKQLQIEVDKPTRPKPIKSGKVKARNVYAWVSIIETQFLRHLANKQQTVFSSQEFYNWVEYTGIILNERDIAPYGGDTRPCWRQFVSKAFLKLRDRKVIYIKQRSSSVYSTIPPSGERVAPLR